MDRVLLFFVLLLGFLCCHLVTSKELEKYGPNVCSYKETQYKEKRVSTIGNTIVVTIENVCCDWWCTSTCEKKKRRTATKVIYRNTVVKVEVDKYVCCSGWSRAQSDDPGCTKAICNVDCQNGGKCTSPGVCTCVNGFEGKYCQNDVNECKDPRLNNCHQSCINTLGSYRCGCKRGFKLETNGVKCEDIDECKTGVCKCAKETKSCKANCLNTPGSYKCSCPKGYEQRIPNVCRAMNMCEGTKGDETKPGRKDRDECIENSNLCDHKCQNFEGGYRCQCFKGYDRNNVTGKCEDIDECSQNNGGCSHKCHNVVGGRVCSCPSGFYLEKDKKTCEAIKASDKEDYICEGDLKVLQCSYPDTVAVLYATYGRLSDKYCQKGNYTTSNSCQFANVMPYLAKRCDNKSLCAVLSSTKVFSQGTFDPCPDTSKYLHVVHRCAKGQI